MNKRKLNNSHGTKSELKTRLYHLNYFRSKKQLEQYKMFFQRIPKQPDFRSNSSSSVQNNIQHARSSDATFAHFQNRFHRNEFEMNEYSANYLHTPGITYGIRPGLGTPTQFCDCSKTEANRISSNSVLTALVSIQYLTLMCTSYCITKLKQRNHRAKQSNLIGKWKPSYIPYKETEYLFKDKSNDQTQDENTIFYPKMKLNKYKNMTSFISTKRPEENGLSTSYHLSLQQPTVSPNITIPSILLVTVEDNMNLQTERKNLRFESKPLNKPLSNITNDNLTIQSPITNQSNYQNRNGHLDDNDQIKVSNMLHMHNSTSQTRAPFLTENNMEGKR